MKLGDPVRTEFRELEYRLIIKLGAITTVVVGLAVATITAIVKLA